MIDGNVVRMPTLTGIRSARHNLQACNHGPLLGMDQFAAFLTNEDYENLVKDCQLMARDKSMEVQVDVKSAAGATIYRGAYPVSFMIARDGTVEPIIKYKGTK